MSETVEEEVYLNGFSNKIVPDCAADEIDGYQTTEHNLSSAVIVNRVVDIVSDTLDSTTFKTNGEDESSADASIEATENSIENELREENDRLKENLSTLKTQYGNLHSALQQKENLVELQKKELTLCESEKESLKRDYESAKKEKEHAVVRYAMLEKNIIDVNTVKDLSARKLKDSQREVELLTNRLKSITSERDKSYKEVRETIRENETLKYDLQTCETKFKWNQVKLKQELSIKNELEKRLNEITHQLNQLSEQRQHQIDTEKKYEQEQGAQLIMLKHLADEKERNLNILQKSMNDMKSEFSELSEKYTNLLADFDAEKQTNNELSVKLDEHERTIAQQKNTIDHNTEQLNATKNTSKIQVQENEHLSATIQKLKYIEECYKEQSEEMATLRTKEDELLKLLKDLTEKCVLVENKLILANSKSSGLMLDNERLNKEHKSNIKTMQDLEDELIKLKLKHNEEIKLFNRILADEKSNIVTLQSKLDNVLGDLEATKNKHSQIVKELNRELCAMRTKQSNGLSLKSEQCSDTHADESNGISSGHHLDATKEPSKKALIDRIVKLQRLLAKQTEKIEFLENHCVALFNELRAKTG